MWKRVLGWVLTIVLGPVHIVLGFLSKASLKLWTKLLPEMENVEAALKKFFNLK
jgi:hypothetical protein